LNKIIPVRAGSILSFGTLKSGFRSYVGVAGGFKTSKVLNSRSMYPGITTNSVIKKNDTLLISGKMKVNPYQNAQVKIDKSYLDSKAIAVCKGPEFYYLSEKQQKLLEHSSFHVSKENSRMAYQLQEPLDNNLKPILTSAVIPGTVQLTPSGKLIILMRDCQTTGGYPRVLQLKDAAIAVLAQKFTNEEIRFNF